MIKWAIDLYLQHTFWMATLGYALPFVVNTFIFSKLTVSEYRKDLADRAAGTKAASGYDYYYPKLTVGCIVPRILGTVLPVINTGVMIRNSHRILAFISNIFQWIGDIMEIPLVPKNPK